MLKVRVVLFFFFFSFYSCWHNAKKEKAAQLSEFFTSSSSGISDTWRRAACPSHSSGAITVDDSVYSLQEMSLKTGKDKLHLFVTIIKLEKVETVEDTKLHSQWKYICPVVLCSASWERNKTSILPCRRFCFCSSRKAAFIYLNRYPTTKIRKQKVFAAVY